MTNTTDSGNRLDQSISLRLTTNQLALLQAAIAWLAGLYCVITY